MTSTAFAQTGSNRLNAIFSAISDAQPLECDGFVRDIAAKTLEFVVLMVFASQRRILVEDLIYVMRRRRRQG